MDDRGEAGSDATTAVANRFGVAGRRQTSQLEVHGDEIEIVRQACAAFRIARWRDKLFCDADSATAFAKGERI